MCMKIFFVGKSSEDSIVKLSFASHRRPAPTSFAQSNVRVYNLYNMKGKTSKKVINKSKIKC